VGSSNIGQSWTMRMARSPMRITARWREVGTGTF
jgi:hypothetical protein